MKYKIDYQEFYKLMIYVLVVSRKYWSCGLVAAAVNTMRYRA